MWRQRFRQIAHLDLPDGWFHDAEIYRLQQRVPRIIFWTNLYRYLENMAGYAGLAGAGYGAYLLGRRLGRSLGWRRTKRRIRRTPYQRMSTRIRKIEQGKYKELKTYDDVPINGAVSSTGAIVAISDMAQGDTSITREGLQIQPRTLEFKIFANYNTDPTYLRIIIFKDREQHGTAPTVAELLEADSFSSWKEHDTRPRFKVYRDILLTGNNTQGAKPNFIKGMIKFSKKSKIWYTGTTAAAGDAGKNNLYIYRVSNNAADGPDVVMATRLRYVDG